MTISSPALVKPAFCWTPPHTQTLGPQVADLCARADFAPDPEQAEALNMMFALRPGGKVAAFEFAIVCARQNMKTALFKQAVLGWLFIMEQRLVVWSAHEMGTTKEAFIDIVSLIENCAPLRKRLAPGRSNGVYRGNGDESIVLASGQRLKFKARTHGGGRGLTGDKIILDEAMYLKSHHMGSLLPTLSAVPDPQVVYGSSAGLVESEILRAIRDRGRAGGDPSLAYMEFCSLPEENACEDENCSHSLGVEGCALDDIEYLRQANPALGRRIGVDYVRAERRALSPEEFGRERAGWWDKPDVGVEPLIDVETWSALTDVNSEPIGDVAFGVYVNAGRTSSAIGVCGKRADGKFHVGIVPAVRGKSFDSLPGTRWIPERLKELVEKWGPCPVMIDGHSAAASLITGIEEAGVLVTSTNSTDLAKACGNFYDAVTAGTIAHTGGRPLVKAVGSGRQRELNDAWVWDRKDRASDISQLMAVTLALHGVITMTPTYNLLDSVW